MSNEELTARLFDKARTLGFELVGCCPAVEPPRLDYFHRWLKSGNDGQMSYLRDRREAYRHPKYILDGVRSVVMLGTSYRTAPREAPRSGQGQVSRYAWGTDYHDVIRSRLHELTDNLRDARPEAKVRGVVDTAPLLEREFAEIAGLGWVGKNTLLLNRQMGSWFFLAALLTDIELQYNTEPASDHCGTCRACLDACPTDAFVEPYVLDSRRCVSYLTIEMRDAVPMDLRPGIGSWLLGCDICQDVCPWNRRAAESPEPSFLPTEGMNPVDLTELFGLDDDGFRQRFRHTPLWRPRRRGVLRNAAIVLGNQREPSTVPALIRGLADTESIVRGASAWALGQCGGVSARAALQQREPIEDDPDVSGEIRAALREIDKNLEEETRSPNLAPPG